MSKNFKKVYSIKCILIINRCAPMPKRFIRFNIPQQQPKKDLFLRDPKADFIVILEKKIFPLHKQLLAPSAFFQELIDADKKSVAINAHLNSDIFEQILGCFYGIEAAFQRHNIIDHILGIFSLIRTKVLEDQLKADMTVNFQQYGLFNLFYLSRRFGLKDVEDKCIKELIDEDFEQINYNKYDLFQLSPELFTFILKEHERCKAKRDISGLDAGQIRAVCQEYCKTTNSRVSIEEIFRYGRDFLKESLSQAEQNEAPQVRRRNATWHNSNKKQQQISLVRNESNHISSDTKIYSFEQKENQVMKIRLINSNLQENNSKLAAEIKSVRSSIDKSSSKDLSYGVDDLDKKLKQFEEKSKNAHKKMQELKNKMMKIKLDDDHSENDEKEDRFTQKITRSGKLEQGSKVLSGMAVLQKSENIDSDDSDF